MSRFALFCDLEGSVQEILLDDGQLFAADAVGMPLSSALTDSAIGPFFELLARLTGAEEPDDASGPYLVHEWQLVFDRGDVLHCAGVGDERRVFLCGARDPFSREQLSELASQLVAPAAQHCRALAEGTPRLTDENSPEAVLIAELRAQIGILQEQARAPEKLENELIRIAAHDLRNPLLALQMNGSYLLRGDGLTPQQQLAVHDMMGTCTFMNRFLDGMTSLSQVWVGTLALERTSVQPAELLQEVVGHFAPLAKTREMSIELASPDEGISVISADRDKLTWVLHELLGNALKFCPAGTTVRAGAARASHVIRLHVDDDGPGISANARRQLFRPFGKSPVESRFGHGAGVGLPIARRIVEAHGGALELDSRAGRGTRVTAVLPMAERAPLSR